MFWRTWNPSHERAPFIMVGWSPIALQNRAEHLSSHARLTGGICQYPLSTMTQGTNLDAHEANWAASKHELRRLRELHSSKPDSRNNRCLAHVRVHAGIWPKVSTWAPTGGLQPASPLGLCKKTHGLGSRRVQINFYLLWGLPSSLKYIVILGGFANIQSAR